MTKIEGCTATYHDELRGDARRFHAETRELPGHLRDVVDDEPNVEPRIDWYAIGLCSRCTTMVCILVASVAIGGVQ